MAEYTLNNFFSKLEIVLTDLYHSQRLIFRSTFRESFTIAFDETIDEINTLRVRFEDLNPNLRLELKGRGLEDESAQLQTKMVGFLESYDEYEQEAGIWRAKRFLKYSKIILGSLGSFIPGGHLIKEFIEAVELGIEGAERQSK